MRVSVLLLSVVALFALTHCDTASSNSPQLGDAYKVEMQPAPLLDGDVLRVTVSYSGGCETHTFELAYSVTEAEADLWLEHDANGDLCEAYITDDIALPVPMDALMQRPIRLYVNDMETIILLMESLQR